MATAGVPHGREGPPQGPWLRDGQHTFASTRLQTRPDTTADFGSAAGGGDRSEVSASAFGAGLVAGQVLAADQVATVDEPAVAGGEGPRFIWVADDTRLWFDSNGNSAGGLTLLADLQAGATLNL